MEMQKDNQILSPELIESSNTITDSSISFSAVYSTIEQLLASAFQQIKEKQLLTCTPTFSHNNIMNLLSHYIYQSSPCYGTINPSKIYEESCSDIIKIEKDNLSPKQLSSQHPQKDQAVKQLPQTFSAAGSGKFGITNRSSFLKRKSSQMSQLPSGSATQRSKIQSNMSFKSNNHSPQKLEKSKSIKKNPLQNFTLLAPPQNEDPEISHLRQKVIFNHKEMQKQQKLKIQRIKEDQMKIDSFKSQYGQHGRYTFDFDGQTIGSEAIKDEKINYYAMRVGVHTLGKKFRTIYKNQQSINGQQKQNQELITKNKLSKQVKPSYETINVMNSNTDIPTFERQSKSFMQQTDPSKLKIIEYKRLYGKKFSRYDKNSMTIDLSSVIDKKITEEDFFSSKKHLTDSISINKSRSSSVNKQYPSRKLALPRLQGKYKVLDRYEEI